MPSASHSDHDHIEAGTVEKAEGQTAKTVKWHMGHKATETVLGLLGLPCSGLNTCSHHGSVIRAGKGCIIKRGEERSRSSFWLLFQALQPSCCFFGRVI